MAQHVCPWWGGYFIDNRLRRLLHNPQAILGPYIEPGMTVIDFGCGMGVFSIALARLVGADGRVIAIDVQPQMLSTLEKRAHKAGVAERIQTHRSASNSLAISVRADFVLAFYSAHEVPDLRHLLGEFAGCLRPLGRLLWVEPVGHVPKRQFQEMLALAVAEGFRVDDHPRVRLSHAALLTHVGNAPSGDV